MEPPSTKENVGKLVKYRSNQEEIESNMETGGEGIKSSAETKGYRTGYNVEKKENGMKNISTAWIQRKKKETIHKLYAKIVRG